MERCYLRSSSLARKFFDDFPDASNMPLEFMSTGQHRAYEQHVLPLLDLFNQSPSLASCCGAVKQLTRIIQNNFNVYEQSRAAAEYIQSPFAMSMLDAAAGCSVHPQAASWYDTLSMKDPTALDELLYEDVRRRLIANSLQDLTNSLAVQLDKHPAVSAARPHPTDPDRLLLPIDAAYSTSSSTVESIGGSLTASAAATNPLPHSSGSDRGTAAPAPAGDAAAIAATSDADATAASEPPSILKRAAWRRQLSRLSSHYLAPILGRDGPGTVVLTGSIIADVLRGTKTQHYAVKAAATGATAAPDGDQDAREAAARSSVSSSSSMCISFVGYQDAAAAQGALNGCLEELLTRWFMRHPTPLIDPQGHPLLPLAVAAQHHLLLLLPEPTEALLPAAVNVDAAALAAAVDHGAFQGPAAAAAAAAGDDLVQLQQVVYRDVMFDFDLALHPSMEVLLLGAAAAGDLVIDPPAPAATAAAAGSDNSSSVDAGGSTTSNAPTILLAAANAMNAFAYGGDDVYTLPSAVRALASGRGLINPAGVANIKPAEVPTATAGEVAPSQSQPSQLELSPSELVGSPALLRALLDDSQHQPQQHLEDAAAAAASVRLQESTGAVGVTGSERNRLVQQLRRDHGWTWGVIHKQPTAAATAAAAGYGQQQQLYELPEHVMRKVAVSWWKGPVMRGSVLYGSEVKGAPTL